MGKSKAWAYMSRLLDLTKSDLEKMILRGESIENIEVEIRYLRRQDRIAAIEELRDAITNAYRSNSDKVTVSLEIAEVLYKCAIDVKGIGVGKTGRPRGSKKVVDVAARRKWAAWSRKYADELKATRYEKASVATKEAFEEGADRLFKETGDRIDWSTLQKY
jgi:hypothetical protein